MLRHTRRPVRFVDLTPRRDPDPLPGPALVVAMVWLAGLWAFVWLVLN